MTLSSMTGFARSDGETGAWRWSWELKSVNGRGLDMRLRLPPGLDGLETKARSAISARFKRGSLQVGLQLTRTGAGSELRVNDAALSQVIAAMETVRTRIEDAAPPRLDGLLALKGVLELSEQDDSDEARDARNSAILADLEAALDALAEARGVEGARLHDVLSTQIGEIEALTKAARHTASLRPDALRERLKTQVSALMEASGSALNPERLAQEAALLAVKADVAEELDRLDAHIEAARDLLCAEEPVGRKLDFLIQEFNREANTLCSKAGDIALTRIGLDLKAVIDQLREQVQNVE